MTGSYQEALPKVMALRAIAGSQSSAGCARAWPNPLQALGYRRPASVQSPWVKQPWHEAVLHGGYRLGLWSPCGWV